MTAKTASFALGLLAAWSITVALAPPAPPPPPPPAPGPVIEEID